MKPSIVLKVQHDRVFLDVTLTTDSLALTDFGHVPHKDCEPDIEGICIESAKILARLAAIAEGIKQ